MDLTDHRGVGVVAVVSVAVIAAFTATVQPSVAAAQPRQPEIDNTVTRIHVYQNGSARWIVRIRTRLDTAALVSEYEAFQAHFRANTSQYLDPFRERMKGVVSRASNVTDREMRAVNFSASTSIQVVPRRWGVVTYRFTWVNFAAQRNETLVVGDVFQGGFFLAAHDALEIVAPAGYEVVRVEPTPASRDDGVVTWVGREDFPTRHPHVVFAPLSDQSTADGRQSGTDPATSDGSNNSHDSAIDPVLLVAGILFLGFVAIGTYAVWRRRIGPDTPDTKPTGTVAPETDSPPASGTDPSSQQSRASQTRAGHPESDETTLTDTERVQNLLETSDGRMRQGAIADEFDWSASKVSRVIGKLVDNGTVEKLQLGRENLIDLVDEDE